MANALNKLTARKVATLTKVGRHADGGGLYLVIDKAGGRRWVMLYSMATRRREMGLGPVADVPLAKARELAAAARAKIALREDPIDTRDLAAAPDARTFGSVAEEYMKGREKTWKSAIHRAQWRQTLEVQAASLWGMLVAKVTTEDVLAVLSPMWPEKPETARRLRGRIERVLEVAIVRKFHAGPNPAMWKGHLRMILPPPPKLTRGHHVALAYKGLPAFYASLGKRVAPSADALRFIILTAARSGEVRGAVWGEVDLTAATWTIPAVRMKAKREHRVALSGAAVEILRERQPADVADRALVFPGVRGAKMSDMIFKALFKRAKQDAITTHGFRSSFRDWADAETDFPGPLAEAALAHLVGDETERAYRRGDALEKRRALMEAWAAFVTGAGV